MRPVRLKPLPVGEPLIVPYHVLYAWVADVNLVTGERVAACVDSVGRLFATHCHHAMVQVSQIPARASQNSSSMSVAIRWRRCLSLRIGRPFLRYLAFAVGEFVSPTGEQEPRFLSGEFDVGTNDGYPHGTVAPR